MSSDKDSQPFKEAKQNTFHWYSPRFWEGMTTSVWWGILCRNRFRIHPTRWGLAFMTTLFAFGNSVFRVWENVLYRSKIREARVEHAPLFIVGHWRSGTTYLHELLVLDPRYTYPRTIDCLLPNQFLHCGDFLRKYTNFVLPSRRPMDNMATGWDRPQEDEFALMNLGEPSPYLSMAFPNHPPVCSDYLDFEGVSSEDRERWKGTLMEFLRRLQIKDQRRLVLKSPTHTGRLEVLAEMFPDAKFVHIVRDPYSVFPSTVRLWKALNETQGLQSPKHKGLEEYVFTCFERMMSAFDRGRKAIPASQLCEVRYEDLASDPIGEVRKIYEQLDLGEFEGALPYIEEHVAGLKEYKTNTFQLDESTTAEIERRWGTFIERYGYGRTSDASKLPVGDS